MTFHFPAMSEAEYNERNAVVPAGTYTARLNKVCEVRQQVTKDGVTIGDYAPLWFVIGGGALKGRFVFGKMFVSVAIQDRHGWLVTDRAREWAYVLGTAMGLEPNAVNGDSIVGAVVTITVSANGNRTEVSRVAPAKIATTPKETVISTPAHVVERPTLTVVSSKPAPAPIEPEIADADINDMSDEEIQAQLDAIEARIASKAGEPAVAGLMRKIAGGAA